MASGSAGPQPTSTLEAKMPIQDLDNALSQALQAAESAAKATTRGLKGALASCDVKTQKALEASQCSAQAAHESIKAARSTLKAAKLERRPWIAAYDSFMKKSHRYWRIKPKATNSIPAKRQREESSSSSAESTSSEEQDEYELFAYWTHDGNLAVEDHPDTEFRPATFDSTFGRLRRFESVGGGIDPVHLAFRFRPQSQDVLVRLAREYDDDMDRWMVLPSRCPFAAWAPRQEP